MRVGLGIDAHRFDEGRPLVLCGVRLENCPGLAGHSDADVAVHALMDALLGAAGAGDIGDMFPDTDAAYAGASSMGMLARVLEVVSDRGFAVENVDLVIVGERPRISGARARMRETLAGALGIELERVSVKGTTTEKMGFAGREEGLMAAAVVLLDSEERTPK